MKKNTSITLSDHFQHFIKNEVESGRYNNTTEVIRTALRLLEQEQQKHKAIKEALKKGEESGFVEDFDSKENLKNLHNQHS